MIKRLSQDNVLMFNIVVCLFCLTYLYSRLDKELTHVYKYVKTLDSEMVRMLHDIEVQSAAVSNVQNPPT